MAKTQQWTPRRVRNEEDRKSGSSEFITLDEGEKFLGYALFAGDPAKDEPGYYEFLQHWVGGNKSGRSIPCAGDDCPFCEDGDKPRDVAFTLWNVIKDANGNELGKDGEGELRIFRANSLVIKQLTEMRSEDDPIMGIQFRVSRVDDRGNYMLQPKAKKLSKTEVKELLKSDDAPDFDQMVTSMLRRGMEGVSTSRAMDDDDDDDDDKPAKNKKKSKKSKEKDTEEWPDALDGETVTVVKVEKKGNWIEVSHDDYEGTKKVWTTQEIEFDLSDLSEDDEVTVTTGDQDGDGDFILSEEPEAEEAEKEEEEDDDAKKDDDDDPEAEELPDGIEDETFTVVSVDTKNQTMDVKCDDPELEFTLYFLDKGPASKVDFDDYEEGTVITLSAEKDSVGDMVATAVPEIVEADKKAKKKSGGGKKKSEKKETAKKGGKTKGGKGK